MQFLIVDLNTTLSEDDIQSRPLTSKHIEVSGADEKKTVYFRF